MEIEGEEETNVFFLLLFDVTGENEEEERRRRKKRERGQTDNTQAYTRWTTEQEMNVQLMEAQRSTSNTF